MFCASGLTCKWGVQWSCGRSALCVHAPPLFIWHCQSRSKGIKTWGQGRQAFLRPFPEPSLGKVWESFGEMVSFPMPPQPWLWAQCREDQDEPTLYCGLCRKFASDFDGDLSSRSDLALYAGLHGNLSDNNSKIHTQRVGKYSCWEANKQLVLIGGAEMVLE